MLHWKDILCLLAILIAWGVAGHLDYEDAIALEEAQRTNARHLCMQSRMTSLQRTTVRSADASTQGGAAKESAGPCLTDEQ